MKFRLFFFIYYHFSDFVGLEGLGVPLLATRDTAYKMVEMYNHFLVTPNQLDAVVYRVGSVNYCVGASPHWRKLIYSPLPDRWNMKPHTVTNGVPLLPLSWYF